jgi:putative ABC transport system permease protein
LLNILFDNLVGKRIEYTWGLEEPIKGRIIGVVKDFHYASLHTEVEPLIISYNPDYNRYLSIRFQRAEISEVLYLRE